jgi:hypothetical protein
MNEAAPKGKEKNLMKSPNFVAIMAILTEMARRLNENISKVELKPLQSFDSVARPNQQS